MFQYLTQIKIICYLSGINKKNNNVPCSLTFDLCLTLTLQFERQKDEVETHINLQIREYMNNEILREYQPCVLIVHTKHSEA